MSICEENQAHASLDSYLNCASAANANNVRSDNVLNKCVPILSQVVTILWCLLFINKQRYVIDECASLSLENFVMFNYPTKSHA